MDFYSSSSSQKISKSEFEFEFFIFNFLNSSSCSSWAKKTEFVKFKFEFAAPVKTNKSKAKTSNNGLETGLKTKKNLKTHVTAKYYLLFSFQNYSINELELDLCFSEFEFRNSCFLSSSSSLAKRTEFFVFECSPSSQSWF